MTKSRHGKLQIRAEDAGDVAIQLQNALSIDFLHFVTFLFPIYYIQPCKIR